MYCISTAVEIGSIRIEDVPFVELYNSIEFILKYMIKLIYQGVLGFWGFGVWVRVVFVLKC